MTDLTQQILLRDLTRKFEKLEERVASLESTSPSAKREKVKLRKRPGPRPILSNSAYTQRWNVLFFYLTCNWPELRLIFRSAESEAALRGRLHAVRTSALPIGGLDNGVQSENALIHFIEHSVTLWEFLHSKRYAQHMRNVAHAMAGVPHLNWRTSLDIGHRLEKQHLLTSGHGERGMLDHFRLRHKEVFRLLHQQEFDKAAKNLKLHSCTDCEFFEGKPDRLAHFWDVGHPRSKSFGPPS